MNVLAGGAHCPPRRWAGCGDFIKIEVITDMQYLMPDNWEALKAMTSRDFTGGATYFHRYDLNPEWAATKTFTARYGAHRFYRDGRKTTPIYAFNQTSLFLQPLSVISTPKS